MAATKRNASKPDDPRQAKTRAAIRTTQLVKRLEHFALGEISAQGAAVDLDTNAIRAIDILLRKVLPDLSAVTVDGTMSHGVTDTLADLLEKVAASGNRIDKR